uniref:WASP homolog-associated protein with actin, membranes and microtubules n=1 Tax=Geotrypetes seraphini TaxID=260995 RepID=A0A6P8P6C4_GEOSA|nr:WASP homolog-associated protein with actin, membranes and microtubules [Geotrypetes seraphini]
MECERVDSLEGWVAVRPQAFEELERCKLGFLVGWNEVEGKFAVTCHDRTRQRQRGGAAVASAEPSSWAGLFSVPELRGLHRQLSALAPALESRLPHLHEPPAAGSLWSLLFPGGGGLEEAGEDAPAACGGLERYLSAAAEACGRKVLLDVLFAEDAEEYFESLHELRRKRLEERVRRAKEALRRVLHQHKNTDNMVALMQLYEEEDEAYEDLVTLATEFYQYLLQPFRDMRELAVLYKLEILKSLEMDELGPKRIETLEKEAEKWTKQAEEAVCSIQNITVSYFKETVKALEAMHKQMEQDGMKFGKATWASAVPRLEKLKYVLAKETLQHMRAKELCLNHKRSEIRQHMENLAERESSIDTLDKLEMQYYETQLELYAIQFEIVKHEEMLLMAQLDTIRRQIKEKEDEVVYYDACEDPGELNAADWTSSQHHARGSEMRRLRLKAQQLESKRGNICVRRAYLRNKKDKCQETQELKLQQAQETMKHFHQHHSIQMKRDKRKEDEKRKKEWVDQERQKTLQRLKSFKEKCPTNFVLKTSSSQTLERHSQGVSQHPSVTNIYSMQSVDSPVSQSRDCSKAQKDFSEQIFISSVDLKEENHNGMLLQPTRHLPPIPPPPPPPPPPPIPQLLRSRPSLETDSKPLPLICEESAKSPTPERREVSLKPPLNHRTGSMDEVLATLKRGETLLRKVEWPSVPVTGGDVRESILLAIRQGVKLRKVKEEPKVDISKESENEFERSIKAAIQRIKKVSNDTDEEEISDKSGEWDS